MAMACPCVILAWDFSLCNHAKLNVNHAALCSPKNQTVYNGTVIHVWIMPCTKTFTLDGAFGEGLPTLKQARRTIQLHFFVADCQKHMAFKLSILQGFC